MNQYCSIIRYLHDSIWYQGKDYQHADLCNAGPNIQSVQPPLCRQQLPPREGDEARREGDEAILECQLKLQERDNDVPYRCRPHPNTLRAAGTARTWRQQAWLYDWHIVCTVCMCPRILQTTSQYLIIERAERVVQGSSWAFYRGQGIYWGNACRSINNTQVSTSRCTGVSKCTFISARDLEALC